MRTSPEIRTARRAVGSVAGAIETVRGRAEDILRNGPRANPEERKFYATGPLPEATGRLAEMAEMGRCLERQQGKRMGEAFRAHPPLSPRAPHSLPLPEPLLSPLRSLPAPSPSACSRFGAVVPHLSPPGESVVGVVPLSSPIFPTSLSLSPLSSLSPPPSSPHLCLSLPSRPSPRLCSSCLWPSHLLATGPPISLTPRDPLSLPPCASGIPRRHSPSLALAASLRLRRPSSPFSLPLSRCLPAPPASLVAVLPRSRALALPLSSGSRRRERVPFSPPSRHRLSSPQPAVSLPLPLPLSSPSRLPLFPPASARCLSSRPASLSLPPAASAPCPASLPPPSLFPVAGTLSPSLALSPSLSRLLSLSSLLPSTLPISLAARSRRQSLFSPPSPSLAVAHPPVPFVSRSHSSLSLALGLSSPSRRPPVDLLPPSQSALPSTSCLPLSPPSRRPPASLSVLPPADLSLPLSRRRQSYPPSHHPLSSHPRPHPVCPPSRLPLSSPLASGTPSLALSLEVSLASKRASLPAPLSSFCSRSGGSDPHPRRRRRPSPLSRPPSGPLALSSSWSGW